MSEGAWVAVIAAVGTALTGFVSAVVTGLVMYLNARHKNAQEHDATALAQYREVADRLQRHVEQRDAHIQALSEGYDQLSEEHGECQVEVAELYGYLALVHDFAKRVAGCCKRLGDDPGDVPPMPARPARPDRSASEFRRRQLKQGTELLKSGAMTPPPPLPGGPTP